MIIIFILSMSDINLATDSALALYSRPRRQNAKLLKLPHRIVRPLAIAIASTIAIGLGSCAPTSSPSNSSASPQAQSSPVTTEELQVVTTFLPVTQFTKAVAGDRAEVTQLLPTNVGPHDYQAKPEDAQKLSQADVLVQNGLEMEEFLEDLVKNTSSPNLKIIDSSEGIATITTEEIEGHDHTEGEAHDREGEKQAEAEHSHDHGKFNPHIWLDPKRAIEQVENIRDGLIAADPQGKEVYTANAAAYITKLRNLDSEIATALQPYAGKTFVAFHDFAPYFAQSYKLKAEFLVDVPEENLSPEDVKHVVDTVQATNLKTILTEPQAGKDSLAALADDLKVQVSTFDPIETGGSEALQPDYYLTTMRQNLNNLKTAFTGQPTQSFLPMRDRVSTVAFIAQPVELRF